MVGAGRGDVERPRAEGLQPAGQRHLKASIQAETCAAPNTACAVWLIAVVVSSGDTMALSFCRSPILFALALVASR